MAQSINKRSLRALNKVIKLFSNASRWTKGSYQETLRLRNREVECYCLAGALRKAANNSAYSDTDVSINLITLAGNDPGVIGHMNRKGVTYERGNEARVTSYNDASNRTYPQIMALLDRMKSRLEAKVNAEA